MCGCGTRREFSWRTVPMHELRKLGPDDNRPAPLVRFCGVRWRGWPMPLRWAAAILATDHPAPSDWRGCGCIDRLKALTERIRS